MPADFLAGVGRFWVTCRAPPFFPSQDSDLEGLLQGSWWGHFAGGYRLKTCIEKPLYASRSLHSGVNYFYVSYIFLFPFCGREGADSNGLCGRDLLEALCLGPFFSGKCLERLVSFHPWAVVNTNPVDFAPGESGGFSNQ